MKTGINVGKRGLMFVDKLECDFCDKKRRVAVLNWVGDNVIVICKDCVKQLHEILTHE